MKLFSVLETNLEHFDNTIITYLEKSLGSMNVGNSRNSIYMIIFNGIKGVMQNMLFYFEDVLQEQNIFTATRKKSVYSLAKLSGYEPFYGTPASGTLIAKLHINNGVLNNNVSSKIILYNHTEVVNSSSGVKYTINLPTSKYVIDLTKPLFIYEFNIIQGYYTDVTYTAAGLNLETISVESNDLCDTTSIEVMVDGEMWDRVGTLYDMTENGKQYFVSVGFDNSFDVIFGNAIFGQKLKAGQNVSITYIKHGGIMGNINNITDADFSFSGIGFDSYGNPVDLNNYIKLECKNIITGGVNADSINFIRSNIGLNSRSSVLVSEDNFKLFLKRFSFIGASNIYVNMNKMNILCVAVRDLSSVVTVNSDYLYLDPSEYLLKDEEKQMVTNTLYNSNKMFTGLTFDFVDPVFRRYCIMCYVKIDDKYNQDVVKQQIMNSLSTYFSKNIYDTDFISKSDVIKYLLDNIEDIKSVSITFISENHEQAYINKQYEKYSTSLLNNNLYYERQIVQYSSTDTPGLDIMGNIQVDSRLEIPIINGPIKYYHSKETNDTDYMYVQPIEIYFI